MKVNEFGKIVRNLWQSATPYKSKADSCIKTAYIYGYQDALNEVLGCLGLEREDYNEGLYRSLDSRMVEIEDFLKNRENKNCTTTMQFLCHVSNSPQPQ